MNGTEQRRHATVAERVDKHVADLTDALDVLDARLFEVASKGQETRREVNELRAQLLVTADHLQRRVVVLEGAATGLRDRFYLLESVHQAFHGRTFWERLRWLVRGR